MICYLTHLILNSPLFISFTLKILAFIFLLSIDAFMFFKVFIDFYAAFGFTIIDGILGFPIRRVAAPRFIDSQRSYRSFDYGSQSHSVLHFSRLKVFLSFISVIISLNKIFSYSCRIPRMHPAGHNSCLTDSMIHLIRLIRFVFFMGRFVPLCFSPSGFEIYYFTF